jgi:hypothetical protein
MQEEQEQSRFRSKVVFVRLTEGEHAQLTAAKGWEPLAQWARRNLLLVAAQGPEERAALVTRAASRPKGKRKLAVAKKRRPTAKRKSRGRG